jgi:hypothetical protein
MSELFSVYQFMMDDISEKVREHVPLKEAMYAAHFYTHNVMARMKLTKRVIITDSGDNIVFEWKDGRVTWPDQTVGS